MIVSSLCLINSNVDKRLRSPYPVINLDYFSFPVLVGLAVVQHVEWTGVVYISSANVFRSSLLMKVSGKCVNVLSASSRSVYIFHFFSYKAPKAPHNHCGRHIWHLSPDYFTFSQQLFFVMVLSFIGFHGFQQITFHWFI